MKQSTGLYKFLDSLGVLEQGAAADIKAAKESYWRNYKREWKRRKRKECKAFTILLNEKELSVVRKKANKQETNVTNYIKQSALSKETSIAKADVRIIRETVMLYVTDLEQFFEEHHLPGSIDDEMLDRAMCLEKRIMNILKHLSEQ